MTRRSNFGYNTLQKFIIFTIYAVVILCGLGFLCFLFFIWAINTAAQQNINDINENLSQTPL